MEEKTIEAMVREKEQEAKVENLKGAEQPSIDEGKVPSMGQKEDLLKNVEGDLKNIETDLKVSTSSEIELGLVGQLKGLIEKIKNGQLDLATAQNLLKSVNTLKGRVTKELDMTNDAIKRTRDMESGIEKLYRLLKNKENEMKEKEQEQDQETKEVQDLLKKLEEKKKNLEKLKGYLLAEKKALKGVNKAIDGISIATQKQIQNIEKPTGLDKFMVAITNGIKTFIKRSKEVNLPKDIASRVPDKSGMGIAKDIENPSEGILKILAKEGDMEKVERILGDDKLKQNLTKPTNMAKEEIKNSIKREATKTQQEKVAERNKGIKLKNNLYEPQAKRSGKTNNLQQTKGKQRTNTGGKGIV